jgi:hypothetical protein
MGHHDGVSYRDLERADAYLGTFIVVSSAEHLRQHERLTKGDSDLEQLIASHARGEPIVASSDSRAIRRMN